MNKLSIVVILLVSMQALGLEQLNLMFNNPENSQVSLLRAEITYQATNSSTLCKEWKNAGGDSWFSMELVAKKYSVELKVLNMSEGYLVTQNNQINQPPCEAVAKFITLYWGHENITTDETALKVHLTGEDSVVDVRKRLGVLKFSQLDGQNRLSLETYNDKFEVIELNKAHVNSSAVVLVKSCIQSILSE